MKTKPLSEFIEENGEHLREPYLVIPLKNIKQSIKELNPKEKELYNDENAYF